jgi:hypothetical protein
MLLPTLGVSESQFLSPSFVLRRTRWVSEVWNISMRQKREGSPLATARHHLCQILKVSGATIPPFPVDHGYKLI